MECWSAYISFAGANHITLGKLADESRKFLSATKEQSSARSNSLPQVSKKGSTMMLASALSRGKFERACQRTGPCLKLMLFAVCCIACR